MHHKAGYFVLEVATQNMRGGARAIFPTLIWDQDHLILVDAGFPGQLVQIREAVEQVGMDFSNLTTVIVTHQDIDHIGSLAELKCALPGKIAVLAHEVEKPYIEGNLLPHKLAQMESNLAGLSEEMKSFYPRMKAAFQNSFTEVDQTLADGQILPFCGGIQIIHTPGHTLGHICLYLTQSKTLIAGDALMFENGRLSTAAPPVNHDQVLYQESLKKLSGLTIDSVICYHGGQVSGDCSRMVADLCSTLK